ncbi:MAG: AtpZ/AtpI family protein [Patescibacteria group bacterium]|nr:AtpZ/AtpI family protein [Patescibacteria group bacterium]
MSDEQREKSEAEAKWSAVRFAWELGYTIAIPLVVLAIGGALLDRWLGTKPWFLLGGVLLSMGISTVGMYLKAIKVISQNRGNPKDNSKTNQEDKKEK